MKQPYTLLATIGLAVASPFVFSDPAPAPQPRYPFEGYRLWSMPDNSPLSKTPTEAYTDRHPLSDGYRITEVVRSGFYFYVVYVSGRGEQNYALVTGVCPADTYYSSQDESCVGPPPCPEGQFRGPVTKQCRTICPTKHYLVKGTYPGICNPNPKGQEKDPDDNSAPDQGDPKCDGKGNPIHVGIGNKFQREIDNTVGIPFFRFYNSDDTGPKHQLGLGWRHSWQAQIVPVNSTYVSSEPADIDPDWAGRWDGGQGTEFTTRLVFYRIERPDGASFSAAPNGQLLGPTDKNHLKLTIGTKGFTLFDGATTEQYDAEGKLTSVTEVGGRSYELAYNGKLLHQVKDKASGLTLTFTYQKAKFQGIEEDVLVKVERSNGAAPALVASYEYNPTGKLTKATYLDGTSRQYLYDDRTSPDKLSGLIDELGVRYATWAYNKDGRGISSEHAGGVDRHTMSYSGSAEAPHTVYTSPLGAVSTYQYQRIGRRVFFTGNSQPAGAGCMASVSKRSYDKAGNVAEQTDFNGNVTRYTFDPQSDLEMSRVEGANTATPRTISTQWHKDFRLPTQIVEPNRTTTLSYDGRGNRTKKTVKAGSQSRSWSYAYNANNQLTSVTDPANRVVKLTYDGAANLATVTNSAGLVTRYTAYNGGGQPLSITRPDGVVLSLTYDPRGRLQTITQGTAVTRYGYTAAGQIQQVTLPNGTQLTYEYDPAQRLVGVKDNQGNSIRYTLDAIGNQTRKEVQDAGGNLAARMTEFEAQRAELLNPVTEQ